MDTISITLMSGAKNSFAFVDLMTRPAIEKLSGKPSFSNLQQFTPILLKILKLDNIDGVVYMSHQDQNLKWDFFNRDGSLAEMCGNAARCAFAWAHLKHQYPKSTQLLTQKGLLQGTVHTLDTTKDLIHGQVSVVMPQLQSQKMQQTFTHENQTVTYDFVNSGVPHTVIELQNFDEHLKLKGLAQFIRHHQSFQPEGTNVTFYSPTSKDTLSVISYERGVEDFTLACGTGGIAAAYSFFTQSQQNSVTTQFPGGNLHIEFTNEIPTMTGPIQIDQELTF